jgi:hypothetical protein
MTLIDQTDGKPVVVSGRDGHGNLQVRKKSDAGKWYTLVWQTGRFSAGNMKAGVKPEKPLQPRVRSQTTQRPRPLTNDRVPEILRVAAKCASNEHLIRELRELADLFESGVVSISHQTPQDRV